MLFCCCLIFSVLRVAPLKELAVIVAELQKHDLAVREVKWLSCSHEGSAEVIPSLLLAACA